MQLVQVPSFRAQAQVLAVTQELELAMPSASLQTGLAAPSQGQEQGQGPE